MGEEEDYPAPRRTRLSAVSEVWRSWRARKAAQWGAAYVVLAFGLLQGISFIRATFELPPAIDRIALVLLATGLPIVLILAWHHGDLGRQRVTRLEAGLLALCAAAGLTLSFLVTAPRDWATPGSDPNARVLAVLPFDALYADPDAQFYADGVAAALANAASDAGVPVVSPTLTFRYRGADKANAARDLGALYVIDGNVRREAGRFHISLHMDDARSGATVLTRAYDAPQTEAGALSERVAADMSVLIGGFDLDQSSVWRFLPRLAHIAQQQRGGDSPAAYESARALAAEAPDSAIVQAMMAMLAGQSMVDASPRQRPQLLVSGRAAARRALAIDPRFADAYVALADLTPHGNWAEREALLRRSLAIDPAASNTSNWLGRLLWEAGKWREAAPLFEVSLSRDPISPEKTQSQLDTLIGQQKWPQARPLVTRATHLWPGERWVAYEQFNLALYGPDPNEALVLIRSGDVAGLDAGDGLHALDRLTEAFIRRRPRDIDATARDCTGPQRQSGAPSRVCFLVLSALGRLDEAFALAYERYPDLRGPTPEARERRWLATIDQFHDPSALFDPYAVALRADSRFAALVERLGLVDYWRTNGPPDFCAVESAPVCVSIRR